MGERVCPGKPHKVLLGYTRCLASIARVGLAASGCGEQQGHSSLRGLLAPTVRWGCRGWADSSGLGEGSGLEISPESSQGGRGKARWGRWVTADYVQVVVVLLEATQNQKRAAAGAQLHSLVPL